MVVTVRTYLNAAEAAIAKSLLDDYGIVCALADENAHLYVPLAAPVRLVVVEEQAEQATRILSGHPEDAADVETRADAVTPVDRVPETESRNPWELLAIAFVFFLPALCVLQIQHPKLVHLSRRRTYGFAAVDIFHFLGWMGILFAICLVALYFYTRRSPELIEEPPPSYDLPPGA